MVYTLIPNYLASSAAVSGSMSPVVGTVGQQDDHLGLGFGILDTAHRIGQAQSDGRTILDQTAVDAVEQVDEHGMVGGQGTLCETLSGKDHQADVVAMTAGDEGRGNRFGRLQAVGFEVFGQHTGRDIQRHDYVDALCGSVLPAVHRLGPGQHHDHQGEDQATKRKGHMLEILLPSASELLDSKGVGHLQSGMAPAPLDDVPDQGRHQQQQQQQVIGIGKDHRSASFLSLARAVEDCPETPAAAGSSPVGASSVSSDMTGASSLLVCSTKP